MRKYLAVAACALLTGCAEREPIFRADAVEIIHVNTESQTINVTVSADGRRATIAFTPRAALQMQAEMQRTMMLMVEGAESLRARPQFSAPDHVTDPSPAPLEESTTGLP